MTKGGAKKQKAVASIRKIAHRTFTRTPGNPHHAFRVTPLRIQRVTVSDVRTSWRLMIDAGRLIWSNKRIMLGLGLLYALLGYFLIGGISQFDYVDFKDAAQQVAGGDVGAVGTAVSLFGAAVTGNLTAPPSDVQQFLAAALILMLWLSLVWAARMLSADKEIRLRDALYNSGTPVIPTLVICAVVAAQLLPAVIGIFVLATAQNGGWLQGGVEAMVFGAVAGLLTLLSAYLVVSSLVALIVVTLPGTYPWAALREARGMVMNRRWGIVLRVLVVAVMQLVVWAIVLIPIFLLDNWLRFDWLPLVPVAVQALAGLTLVYTAVYLYKLYRSLL